MKTKKSILIVDDMASNIQSLASILKDEYQLKVATSGARALEIVSEEKIDLILLDVQMPEMDGYEVLKKIYENEATNEIPVIFVTGQDSTEDEERGLELGAVDYITKPIRPIIVKARVKIHITMKSQRDELLYAAVHDRLTGLYNRHHLDEEGKRKFSRAKRQGDKFSVIMANALHSNKRVEDFVARYGGEEFVILLEDCSSSNGKNKAEILRKTIESLNPEGLSITASFGISTLSDEHESLEAMIKDADIALYRAKETGRNRVVSFTDEEL